MVVRRTDRLTAIVPFSDLENRLLLSFSWHHSTTAPTRVDVDYRHNMDWTTIPSKPRYPAEPVHQEDPLRAQLFLASLFVQLLLRHPRFHSSAWAKLFRIALAPVSIYLALRTPLLHLWQPLEKAAHLRVAIAVQCFFGAMMAIDFAFTDDVFHRVPLDSPTRQTQQGEVANGAAKGQDKAEQLAEHSHGPWEVILWTAEQVFKYVTFASDAGTVVE